VGGGDFFEGVFGEGFVLGGALEECFGVGADVADALEAGEGRAAADGVEDVCYFFSGFLAGGFFRQGRGEWADAGGEFAQFFECDVSEGPKFFFGEKVVLHGFTIVLLLTRIEEQKIKDFSTRITQI